MFRYLASIWASRNFWLSLVINDLHLRYRRSILGVGWSLLHPLATSLVLGLVFHGLFHLPVRQYLPYLLCGLGCWAFITGVVTAGCQTYISAESYIRQHPLPLAIYPLRTTLGVMIHFLIAMGLVTVLTVSLQGWGKLPHLASFILVLPILLLFGWAAGSLAGFINVAFRDTQHIMEVVFQIMFYLTPIIYPSDVLTRTRAGFVLKVNPIAPFVDLIRDPILHGHPAPASTWYATCAITLALVAMAAATLQVQKRRVVFYL